jgi:prolyl 4-hydroxylase
MAAPDLKFYIRTYDQDLAPDVCRQMIESFNALAQLQQRNGRGIRAGLEGSAWTELNVGKAADAGFLQRFRLMVDAALARYNADVGLPIALPNSGRFASPIMKRYRSTDDERFQLHFDAINHVANRYLVLLWYLNDVESGGETYFPQLDVRVLPQAGRLLIFPPYWMYQHEGRPPVSGDKYIISTYLLFEDPPPPVR